MIPPHYIVGHKNPDADTIVSAEVLAWLHNSRDDDKANSAKSIPIRLGELNHQSQWLFEQAGRTPPVLRETCLYYAAEIAKPVPIVSSDSLLREALETMQRAGSDFVIVVNEKKQPLGIVSDRSQRTNYLLQCNIEDFIGTLLDFPHIIAGLPLQPLTDQAVPKVDRLEVPLHKHTILGTWDSKTAVVIGDRDLLLDSIRANPPAAVIVTNVKADRAAEIAAKLPCPSYHYAGSLISMMVRLPGCFPATEAMMEEFTAIDSQMREDEIERALRKSQWGLIVLDPNGAVVGSISARDILLLKRPKVSLVDHSERGQSVHGLSQAEIVEIIDHHRLGDIETIQPLSIDTRPLGSTASILFDRIKETGIPVPASIAQLLLGALISDTLLLTSPTCTESDKKRAKELALLAGVELRGFGVQVLKQNDELLSAEPSVLVNRDCKPFTFESVFFLAAQIETVDLTTLSDERTGLLEEAFMEKVDQSDAAFGVLMITDVLAGRSRILVVETGHVWRSIHLPEALQASGDYWELEAFVSRKKQLIPLLLNNIRESQR
jgi:manganese-dependent inorganic pyrophosphatase